MSANNYVLFAGPDDYTSMSNVELTFRPISANVPQCGNLLLANDDILESDESFLVTLSSPDGAVVFTPDATTVTINNDDSKLLFCGHVTRFIITYCVLVVFARVERAEYTVQENQNSVEVCAEVSGGTQIPVSLALVSIDGSAFSK